MDSSPTAIAPTELNRLLEGPRPPVLLDVRLEEDWKKAHLPGARNNCVFEVAFLDRISDEAMDPTAPVCVYGVDSDSMESRMAAEKLCRLGFSAVYDFREGIEGWTLAGFPTEGGLADSAEPRAIADGLHPIDLGESRIRWIGRNLLNRHEGLIGLKSGSLRIENGKLAGGEFAIDMRSITCLDLAGDPLHDVLVRHLQDHDFFDTTVFPEASFLIDRSTEIPDATPGSPNLTIAGVLTLKGIRAPLEFSACAGITADGRLAAQATLAFDRTLWNVLYGSGKWFRNLGGHLVNDLIELQLRIVAD
jgi:rhodanese-related sulfurtransferase/polyisoprenoid-binding protein YceI